MEDQILLATSGAILGSLITSLLAPYILQSSTRRSARADALRKLLEVELSRWSGSRSNFRKHQIELKAALLVAGGSRAIADQYSRAATVARSFSDLDHEDHFFDGDGGIPMDVAEYASDAATLLSQSLWWPYLWRFMLRPRLAKLQKEHRELQSKYKNKRGEEAWIVRTI